MNENAGNNAEPVAGQPDRSVGQVLAELHPELAALNDQSETAVRLAQVVKVLVELLSKVDQTVLTELEMLSKNNPSLTALVETLQRQGLLNIRQVVAAGLLPDRARITRVQQYSQLLLRWWAALVAGLHSTCEQSSQHLAEALNPANWPVEKKRWSGEEAAYWQYFLMIIRHDLPLQMGDRMKTTQAEKTLEAYSALGGSAVS